MKNLSMNLSFGQILLVVLVAAAFKTDIDQSRYHEGKKHFELVQQKTHMPRYGQCWSDAMVVIESGCRRLTDVVQIRLALAYLNCFLQIQGISAYECPEGSELKTCVQGMSDSDRGTFATFFAHTQDICYFLQAQIWQEQMENTIGRLETTSSQVAEQLESSHELQRNIVSSQNLSLQNQEKLMGQAQNLSDIINASSRNVHSLFEDLKKSTQEQRQVIGDLFKQLSKLQTTILGEVSGFYSVFYYVMSLCVCYILTSVSHTSAARFWLFLLMTVNIIVEQTVMRWISTASTLVLTEETSNDRLYWLQKQCRYFCILLGLVVLATCAYLYRDINAMNNKLLVEIRKQNSDLWRFVTGHLEKLTAPKEDTNGRQEAETSDSDYNSDNSAGDMSDDDSDRTFILPDNYEETDTDSHRTIHEDDVSDTDQTSLDELFDLRWDTVEMDADGDSIESWLDRSHGQFGNVQQENRVAAVNNGSPYNLRPRKPAQSTNISPVVQVESPRSFSKTVHRMQQIAEKNSRLIRATIQHFHQQQPSRRHDDSVSAGPRLNNGDIHSPTVSSTSI